MMGYVLAQGVPQVDPADPIGAGALAYGLSELVKWVVPLLGAVLFSAFNRATNWLGMQHDRVKELAFMVLTVCLMYVGEILHVAISSDPADWTGTFWEGIAAGLVGTLLVKLGIKQVRDPESATRVTP